MTMFAESGTDPVYEAIRTNPAERFIASQKFCEHLWSNFEPYADSEFLIEVRTNFHSRYWEMYLTNALLSWGYKIECPKPGPDVGILVDGKRIWFEAVTPTRGAEGSADQVPEIQYGVAADFPVEQIALRYLASINEKYDRQYQRWLRANTVRPDDAFVVAINTTQLHAGMDTSPPIAIQVTYGVSHFFITIDKQTLETVDAGYKSKFGIKKSSGAEVPSGLFMQGGHAPISGILVSSANSANIRDKFGTDFQLVPNARAAVPLPADFRLGGIYYKVEEQPDHFSVTALEA